LHIEMRQRISKSGRSNEPAGRLRSNPSDPRDLSHPSQQAGIAELAKAIGRYIAEREYRRLVGGNDEQGEDDGEDSGGLREIFDGQTKGQFD
jgi:hypothetical protein